MVDFVKTKELEPGEEQTVSFVIEKAKLASYDDVGLSGHKSSYVLLEGTYNLFAGFNVRDAKTVASFDVEETLQISKLSPAMSPCIDFDVTVADLQRNLSSRKINGTKSDVSELRKKFPADEIAYTGNKNIKLLDVYEGKAQLEDFVAQLNDVDLAALVCGEGMSSPKATPGTSGAFGGQTERLSAFGIPVCAVADGPSGIKIAKGLETTLVPNGTMLACTWNLDLVGELFICIGEELKKYEVDSLLGPGLNIHRTPLCGRNFEYFSEDPYLTGKLGAAMSKGIAKSGAYSTIKHFCCNNLEKARAEYDVVVSERALREIYLKPFEITVKEGHNVLIMTSYNAVNGFWSASNYDLNQTILRSEWGFDNIVMTDWWAKCNTEQSKQGSKNSLEAMVWSGNDLYMVCEDALVKSNSILSALKSGALKRGELQRSCINILKLILKTNTYKDYVARGCVPKRDITVNTDNMTEVDLLTSVESEISYDIKVRSGKNTAFIFKVSSELDSLAQIPINVKVDNNEFSFTINGTLGKEIQVMRFMKTDWLNNRHKISISYSNAVKIECVSIKQ